MAHPTHLQFAYDIIRKTVLVYAHFLVYIQFEQQQDKIFRSALIGDFTKLGRWTQLVKHKIAH